MPHKYCRTFVRSRGKRIMTFETATVKLFDRTQKSESRWDNWHFQTRTQTYVAKLVAEGKAEPVRRMKDGVEYVVGYRAKTPTRAVRRSACTLTLETMDAVSKRATGEDLDFYERRDVEKFEVWALVGEPGLVRPRISVAEQKRAEHLLGAKRLPIGMTFEPGLLAA